MSNFENETELEKALKRIQQLEESNKILANRRIKDLEEENQNLIQSEKEKSHKRQHVSKKNHSSREKDSVPSSSTKYKDTLTIEDQPSSSSNNDRARKQSTTSSGSIPSMKCTKYPKSGRVQSKLKLLGLSDSNCSSEESSEEDQNVAFENLFGCSNLSSDDKNKTSKVKSTRKRSCEGQEPKLTNKSSSVEKRKKLHDISGSERDSSSSPNLSDLEERMKVEEEVMQIIADEEDSERACIVTSKEANEHDQLAAWLGNYFHIKVIIKF